MQVYFASRALPSAKLTFKYTHVPLFCLRAASLACHYTSATGLCSERNADAAVCCNTVSTHKCCAEFRSATPHMANARSQHSRHNPLHTSHPQASQKHHARPALFAKQYKCPLYTAIGKSQTHFNTVPTVYKSPQQRRNRSVPVPLSHSVRPARTEPLCLFQSTLHH